MSGWRESENMCPDFLEVSIYIENVCIILDLQVLARLTNVLYHDLRLMKMYFTPLVPFLQLVTLSCLSTSYYMQRLRQI